MLWLWYIVRSVTHQVRQWRGVTANQVVLCGNQTPFMFAQLVDR
jgi:hypothetical protein